MQIVYSRRQIDREIVGLAWPTITEQILIMMVGIVSTILVSRLGKESMAAVGMVNILINFFQTIFAGLATGSTIVVARVIGESGVKKAKIVLTQSLFMGIIVGILFLICGLSTADFVLKIFFGAADPKVLNLAFLYYKITLIGIPFVILDMVVGGALRGAGDTKTPMYVTTVVNIINAALSIFLIFGVNFGTIITIPALGVKGAAIGAMIARVLGGFMIVYILFRKKSKIHLDHDDKFILDKKIMKRIIKIGIPSFMENLIMQGGMLIMQVLIVTLGTAEVAGYQVGNNIHQLAVMPVMGLATIANTTVGQNLGKRNYDMAEAYAYENNRLAIIVSIAAAIIEIVFAVPISKLYSLDPEVIRASVIVTIGFALIEPLLAIERVSASVMRCAGDIKYVIVTSIIALWTFRVATSVVLVKFLHLGLYGVMIGIFLDFCVRGAMYVIRMKAGNWKYLKV
jgi:putative efflux protein, MATE family